MVPRLGINARRIGTGGHRVFPGNPGTRVVETVGRDALDMNRRHMTGDHHGRMAGRATLLVRAVDEILGTHRFRPPPDDSP